MGQQPTDGEHQTQSSCTRRASSVLYCVAVSPEPHMPDKRTAHLRAGDSKFPELVLYALSAPDMCAAWMMDASPNTFCTLSWLTTGHHPTGRPMLRFKDVCKQDMKLTDMDPNSWEFVATNCGY